MRLQLKLTAICVAFLFLVASGSISYDYESKLIDFPRFEQPAMGRIFPYEVKSRVVFLTKKERRFIYTINSFAVIFGIAFAVMLFFWKKDLPIKCRS